MTLLEDITDRGDLYCQTVIISGGMGYIGGWVPIMGVSPLPLPVILSVKWGDNPVCKIWKKNSGKNFREIDLPYSILAGEEKNLYIYI